MDSKNFMGIDLGGAIRNFLREQQQLHDEIEKLKHQNWLEYCDDLAEYSCPRIKEIERVLTDVNKERDAAVRDLNMIGACGTCGNRTPWCDDNPDACKGYKWRGAGDEADTKKNRFQPLPVWIRA